MPLSEFEGKIVRILDINDRNDVLVINAKATGIASFDACDVNKFFKCSECGQVITEPNLNELEKMAYMSKVMTRKGGYNEIVKCLVVAASLHRGEFCDSVLWAKQ